MLTLVFTLALASAPPAAEGSDKVRLAILGLRNDGVPPAAIAQIVDALALRISQNPRAEVLTATEIQAVLGLEAAKQTLDCDNGTCAAMEEITKGLDVRYIVGGSVAPRDGGALVHLSLVDVARSAPVARASVEVSLGDLRDDLEPAADELLVAIFGAAPPPQDQAVLLQGTSSGLPPLSWIGIAVGGLGMMGGALGGILWVVDADTIQDPTTPFAAKEDARGRYVVDQALTGAGVGIVVVGLALTTAGLLLQE